MITREILEAQLKLYQQGQMEAQKAFEKVKADGNSFLGAIEAVTNLLKIESELEAEGKSAEPSDSQKPNEEG